VQTGTEKAALILRVTMNLHLALYLETVGYFENKDTVINSAYHVAKHTNSQSGRTTVTVVKLHNTACKINTFSSL